LPAFGQLTWTLTNEQKRSEKTQQRTRVAKTEVAQGQEMTLQRPSQRDYVGAALLMLVSAVFAYIVLGQVGAALVCAGCVGVSLMVAKNL
jgi:hypothetical protein